MNADVVNFKDLVGVEHTAERDCYWLVRQGLLRLGVDLPINPAELMSSRWIEWGRELRPTEAARLGDVVAIRTRIGVDSWRHHIGLCLNAFEFLHSMSAGRDTTPVLSRVDKLEPWQRGKLIYLRARPLALEGGVA